ncbi:MAG: flagellar biosynthesis anti-sigma factor FlgM [[Eubacterium] siraeum]
MEFNFARSVEAAKADLAAAVNENTSAERIEALSDSVANGSYDVSPEMIADSILMF